MPTDLSFRSGGSWGGGSIVYVGTRLMPPEPKPGQPVTLTHYFSIRAKAPAGYGFFVHIIDPANGQNLVNADHEFQGGALPMERWPVGEIIQDTHTVTVPPVSQARVVLGFWSGDTRLPVDQPAAHDGNNRMLGPILTDASRSALPEYHIKKALKPPRIDGDLSDAAWSLASPVNLVRSLDGGPTMVRTTVRLLYDDQNVYLAFECEDPDVWGTLMKRDDPLYTQEVVEVFFDANADGKTYNEIEVSPNNVIFDAYFPARRQGMDTSWDSKTKSAVKVRGTINNPADRDEGWSVEMQVPIANLAEVPHIPPRAGDRWRFNLYRLEHLNRQQVEGQAFSPLFIGDFHHLPRFGWLVFE
jgi:hypothetical protein